MIDGGPGPVLARSFFARPAAAVAPDLLGLLLVAGDVVVRLTEVEAYEPDDPASHSFIGRRPRNRVMFGPPGHLYVYRSYGIHWCANVVCADEGVGAAVLLRAAEVCRGEAVALGRRATAVGAPHLLCAGPGRLCAALAITGAHDGADLCDDRSPLRMAVPHHVAGGEVTAAASCADGGRPPWAPDPGRVCRTTRIGITKAAEAPLRWLELGNRTVSRPPARR
ncbi:MAG: DNA-3-methyladenine glycosylase [Acidimicrobiia bacterium]